MTGSFDQALSRLRWLFPLQVNPAPLSLTRVPKRRVGDDIHPGVRSVRAGAEIDRVLLPIRREAAHAVEIGQARGTGEEAKGPRRARFQAGLSGGSGVSPGMPTCWGRAPRAPTSTMLAAACRSVRSASGIWSALRRKTPPGLVPARYASNAPGSALRASRASAARTCWPPRR